ncbi:MAG: hypothetical protein ACYDAD_01325 [Acidimicrobiales bacterium]
MSTGDELLDESQPRVDIGTDVGEMVIACEFDEARPGHGGHRLPSALDRDNAISDPVTGQSRHVDRRQYRGHIDLVVH